MISLTREFENALLCLNVRFNHNPPGTQDIFMQEWQLETCSEYTFLGSCGISITDYNVILIISTMNSGLRLWQNS